jgi:hypothetical protein
VADTPASSRSSCRTGTVRAPAAALRAEPRGEAVRRDGKRGRCARARERRPARRPVRGGRVRRAGRLHVRRRRRPPIRADASSAAPSAASSAREPAESSVWGYPRGVGAQTARRTTACTRRATPTASACTRTRTATSTPARSAAARRTGLVSARSPLADVGGGEPSPGADVGPG